jgi:ATP-dependent Lon protease
VHCPESQGISATLDPRSNSSMPASVSGPALRKPEKTSAPVLAEPSSDSPVLVPVTEELRDKHITIHYGDTGYSYEALFGDYLSGAKELTVEDPYIRRDHQLRNFIQLCELCVQVGTIKKITLITGTEHEYQQAEIEPKFKSLAESLADTGVEFIWRFDNKIHDRELRTDTGWNIRIGRGLDIYQRTDTWIQIGASNLNVRPCMETKVSIIKTPSA